MSGNFTPPPALHVEWECLACSSRSPYIVSSPHEHDDTVIPSASSFFVSAGPHAATSSLVGSGVEGGLTTEEELGTGSCGESTHSTSWPLNATMPTRPHKSKMRGDAESMSYSALRRSREMANAAAGSALLPDDEEDSYLSAVMLDQWHWQTALTQSSIARGEGGAHAQEDGEEARAQLEQMLFAQQQERLLVEEGLLGKRQMRYCVHCGYARCAEVREAIPRAAGPTTTHLNYYHDAQPRMRERDGRDTASGPHYSVGSPPSFPNTRVDVDGRNATTRRHADDGVATDDCDAGGEADRKSKRVTSSLPEVVQHWWRRGRATAQRLLGSPQQRTTPASSPTPIHKQSGLYAQEVGSPAAFAASSRSAPMGDHTARDGGRTVNASESDRWPVRAVGDATSQDGSEKSPTAIASFNLSKEKLWQLYSIEEAFWRLTIPDAAAPFLDEPRALPSPSCITSSKVPDAHVSEPIPAHLSHCAETDEPAPAVLSPQTPPSTPLSGQRRARASPSPCVPGRRLGYRQEVKNALEKLNNVQLNVARMRLEQALQLLSEEEHHRRMSHN